MKEPVDHILRPTLPWRLDGSGALTECGYDASKVKTLTREQFLQRLKDYGQQRSAILTCMTCSATATRWGTWEDDPRLALQREIEWENGWRYRSSEGRGQRLKDELLAISELITAHRDEFEKLINDRERQREWLAKKAEMRSRQKTVIKERGL